MSLKDEYRALPLPQREPVVPVALRPPVVNGPLRQLLAQPATAGPPVPRPVPAAPLRVVCKTPAAPPQRQLLVEFCKMKESYWLEYRKPEGGKWTLHDAPPHLLEQLQALPISEHSAMMERLHYTFVKREESGS